MFQLIMMLTLFPQQPQALAQFQPCVWPNKCMEAPAPAVVATPITTCQWPNPCEAAAEGPIHTCDYPNKCS